MARGKKTESTSKASEDQVEQETGADLPPVRRWIEEIELAKKRNGPYVEKGREIVKRYRDGREESKRKKDRKYNVLWSIVQTMNPLVYSSPPQPFVSRRHNDRDPAARDASMILQRCLAYSLEGDELNDACVDAREDYLLVSRGVIRNKYTPYLKLKQSEVPTYLNDGEKPPKGKEVKKDNKGLFYFKDYQDKVYEECDTEHIHFGDFLHGAAAKWRHVPWVAFRVPLTRQELITRFGKEKGALPPLTINCKQSAEKQTAERNDDEAGMFAKAEVWEIWDKPRRRVYWLCPQVASDFLDEIEDPLELDGFFPCPRPTYGTKTNESLEPTPDFCLWQDIACELDDVTLRIKLLTESLRVVGIYDKSAGDHLKRLLKQSNENDMVPVENWAMFQEKGGLRGVVEWFPLEQVMQVLDKLFAVRQQLLAELYDITGISDIVRGASDPRETARAQAIKGNFANKRLSERQNVFGRMIRESLEIQAQIICKHYSDDTIRLTSSAEQVLTDANGQFDKGRFERALMILRSNPLRRFRIKIDEKKLASADMAEDREQRSAFTASLSQLLQAALPVAEKYPAAGPFLKSIVLFAVRGFDMARSEEQGLEEALDNLINTPAPQEGEEQAAGAAPKSQEEIANDRLKIEKEAEHKAAMLQLERERLELDKKKADDEQAFRMRQLQIKEMETRATMQLKAREVQSEEQQAAADIQLRKQEGDRAFAADQQRQQQEAQNSAHDRGMEERRFGRDVQNDRAQLAAAFQSPTARRAA